MASYHRQSGYLADDEAGHSTFVARVQPKKPLLPEMGPAFKPGHMPHPPSVKGSSAHRRRRLDPTCPQAFGGFLDFLTEGQILDSLQSVVEEATERMAGMKTNTGVPLVEVQDPVEVPAPVRRPRTRPSFSTVHRHRAQPTLCTGHLNNYPSSSSSMSDSYPNLKAGCLGFHFRDSDLDAQDSLPLVKDKLLLEKSLKRMQRLENKGRGLSQHYSQGYSQLWNLPTNSQWTREQSLPWFSELLGSRAGTPGASERGSGEHEFILPKREFKKMKSLLSQSASFDLPRYCSLREPHRTLDFLANQHLFPALQSVISQAVEKLSSARRHNGCPLFYGNMEPSPKLPVTHLLQPDFKMAIPTDKEDADSFPTRASSPKTPYRKSKTRRVSPLPTAQLATRFRLKNTITRFSKKKPLPSILSETSITSPWQEELTHLLTEKAVSLLIYKYKFENNLRKQLGFISFPVTEVLMDIFLGFKKVKGSHICLSSKIDWSCLLHKLEEAELEQQASMHSLKQASKQSLKQDSHTAANLPDTSQEVTTQQETTEPSTQSMHQLEPVTDMSQEQVATESHNELPIFQLLSPRGSIEVEEHTPSSLSEPNLSLFSLISKGSKVHKSKEMVNMEDSKESEEENQFEVEEEEASEDESLPEHALEALISSLDMGHGEPP